MQPSTATLHDSITSPLKTTSSIKSNSDCKSTHCGSSAQRVNISNQLTITRYEQHEQVTDYRNLKKRKIAAGIKSAFSFLLGLGLLGTGITLGSLGLGLIPGFLLVVIGWTIIIIGR